MIMRRTLTSEEYHHGNEPTYDGENGISFKKSEHIAEVAYTPSHWNPDAKEGLTGEGKTTGRWLYNEEPGKSEGILESDIELIMDSQLEPNASIGLHKHIDTEEIYYLLTGTLTITLIQDQHETTLTLHSGDTYRVAPGESHFIKAGDGGARFMVIAARASTK
jgi:mannose-6-phosphate isomerase-like protein (cupin superfamily)